MQTSIGARAGPMPKAADSLRSMLRLALGARGNQPAHQSLLNRRLKVLSPAQRNCFILLRPSFFAGKALPRSRSLTTNIRLSNRVFKSYGNIVDHCCEAWKPPRRSALED